MKTYIFMYQGCALFEVIISAYLMKTIEDICVISDSNKEFKTFEGLTIKPDFTLDNCLVDNIDLLIITGGEIEKIQKIELLKELVTDINEKNKKIAGICSGRIFLEDMGLISKSEKEIFLEGNIIVSESNKYVDLAIEIGKLFNIYENEDDLNETIKYFKYFERCK